MYLLLILVLVLVYVPTVELTEEKKFIQRKFSKIYMQKITNFFLLFKSSMFQCCLFVCRYRVDHWDIYLRKLLEKKKSCCQIFNFSSYLIRNSVYKCQRQLDNKFQGQGRAYHFYREKRLFVYLVLPSFCLAKQTCLWEPTTIISDA